MQKKTKKLKIVFIFSVFASSASVVSCSYIPDIAKNTSNQSPLNSKKNPPILNDSDQYNDISKDYPIEPQQESKSILIYWNKLQKLFNEQYDENSLNVIEESLNKNEPRIIEQYQNQKNIVDEYDKEFQKLPKKTQQQALYYEDIVDFLNLKERLFIYNTDQVQTDSKIKQLEQINLKYPPLITIFIPLTQLVLQNEINLKQLNLFKQIISWIKSLNEFFKDSNKSVDEQITNPQTSSQLNQLKEVFNKLLKKISQMLSLNNYLSLNEPDAIFVGQNLADYYKAFYLDLFKWISQDLNELYYYIFKEKNFEFDDLWHQQGDLINKHILKENVALKYVEFNPNDFENKARAYLEFLKTIKLIKFAN
ncbi:Uncharacterised protein [Mycoplasmopsis citelli]|uniref:Lipoprotein n=1 Tax=Mycoplasmopsis citelli TaxID=171281 RepID=A0A449B135_9BACT|nr:hypothetical protein [Mycoplasmopsis citelli]VEU74281.1 Uncharacterised protein [Mycoplasmopsis citelli]